MAAVHVTLNLFQGPDPAGWMLKPVQHDVIPAELNSFELWQQLSLDEYETSVLVILSLRRIWAEILRKLRMTRTHDS